MGRAQSLVAIAVTLAAAAWVETRSGTTPAAPVPRSFAQTVVVESGRHRAGRPSPSARRLAVRRRLEASIVWHLSLAIGLPYAGSLVGGVQLPPEGVHFFVRAGAQFIFVGPSTGLHGPAGIVQVLVHHDDHLHVRLPAV